MECEYAVEDGIHIKNCCYHMALKICLKPSELKDSVQSKMETSS
jgi:hypothetical protein